MSNMRVTALALFAVHVVSASYFLTLTDPHLDVHYDIGAPADCADYVVKLPCCHKTSIGTGKAGRWGSPKCDSSQDMVDEVLRQASVLYPNPDAVIFLGDNPRHEVLTETQPLVIRDMKIIHGAVDKHFPTTPLYPSIGNHDMFPLYNMPAKENTTLLNEINAVWSKWITDPEAQETIKRGAFYTLKLNDNIRIVSLNQMYWCSKNLVIMNRTDPMGHRTWMENTLRSAEQKKESVWLLYHIPIGDSDLIDSFDQWFTELVLRYSKTIKGMFSGHTHRDQLLFFRNSIGEDASGHLYISPGLTTYSAHASNGAWPTVRIWEYDQKTGDILDFKQLGFNLTLANEQGSIQLYEMYSAKQEWGLKDLSTASWDSVLGLGASKDHFQHYSRNTFVNPDSPETCNDKCLRKHQCTINYPRKTLVKKCEK